MTAQRNIADGVRSASPSYIITPEDSKRIQLWRLWMALLVLFAHGHNGQVFLSEGAANLSVPHWLFVFEYMTVTIIARCSTPAFALISAVLLYRKPYSWRKNVVRKFRSIMVPLLLLTSFWIALYAIGPHIPIFRNFFSSANTRVADWTPEQWFAAYFGWTKEHPMPTLLYPLWFMRDLMLMHLIAPAIQWVIDRIPRLFLCVLAVLLVMKTDSDFHYYAIHQVFIFFCLGYYVVKYDLHLSQLDKIPWQLIALVYALTILGGYLLRDYYDEISAVRGIPNLAGMFFFARCCTKIPEGKWLKRLLWLSEYNIAIYLFQERMLGFSKKFLHHLMPAGLPLTLMQYWALPVIIGAFCVFIGWFLRKYQPKLYSLITGSR